MSGTTSLNVHLPVGLAGCVLLMKFVPGFATLARLHPR
jgi:hypothetical protein